MKKEYDFSKGERGRFFIKNVKYNLPVYLDSDTFNFVKKLADKKKSDISTIENDLLKEDMKIADYIN